MKKRFFAILLCLIAAMTLCVFPMTVSAAEASTETVETAETEPPVVDEPTVEEPAPEPETPVPEVPEASGESESTYHTLFTRIWEFVSTYSGETLSVMGSLILLILNLILKHSSSKASKDAKEQLKGIKTEVGETLNGQNSVVGAVNNMIDSYNAMKASYDNYGLTEDDRNRVVGAVLATNTAILEILTTVYVNSKNLPQGVKDIVNLKYANCLKSLEDDTKLIAIVEAVRSNIGTTTETTENNTEDAEV